MKYFYLSYGEMSLRCLNDLISMDFAPSLVVTHGTYEYENQKDNFYKKIGDICASAGIELVKTDDVSSIKEKLKGFDAGVSAGFMEIIKEDVFGLPEFGILNIHCGKLPEFRGRAPISRAIMEGSDTLILTVHKVDSGLDSGDILLEKEIIVDDEDDVNTLYYKCSFNCAHVLREAFEKLTSGSSGIFTRQDLSVKPKPNQKINEQERKIDWNSGVRTIYNRIRALTLPYPAAYTEFNGRRIYILRSKPFYTLDKPGVNGEITEVNNDFILVKCGDGYIMNYDVRDENMESINLTEEFNKGDRFN